MSKTPSPTAPAPTEPPQHNHKPAREPTYEERELIAETLLQARIVRPYYGRAIAALRPLVVEGLNTVAVDKYWRLYVDPVWLATLTPQHRANVIAAHEVEHLLRDHSTRGTICDDKRAVNCASDAEINDDVALGDLPDTCVLPKHLNQEDGLLMEEYLANMPTVTIHICNPNCGSGSGGEPLPQELDADGSGTGAKGITKDQGQLIREAVAGDVKQHVKENGRGSVPAGIQVWADEVAAAPVTDWRRELVQTATTAARESTRGRDDYTWQRPSRRTSAILRPSMSRNPPKVCVVADTSGSMGASGPEVLGTLAEVKRSFPKATILSCDTEVYNVKQTGGKLIGGGGTDLRPAIIEGAKYHDVVIVITDGDTPWPEELSRPMVAVIVFGGNATAPTWARQIVRDRPVSETR